MGGIYIHIPFCKTKCPYCDFYSLVSSGKESFVEAIQRELVLRKNFLGQHKTETVYFGGGTPSLLSTAEVEKILTTVDESYRLISNPEVTFECNPDDLSPEYLSDLQRIGINRVSLGLQSFHSHELKFLGRRHGVDQNYEALEQSLKIFDNVSVDLIYGLPGSTLARWEFSLEEAFHYPIHHLSAYHLTIEPGTPFYHKENKGELRQNDEQVSKQQFLLLLERSRRQGFLPYELSNFAPRGYFSKHNLAYWQNVPYLGVGPSAHSYNTRVRQWNVSDLATYMEELDKDTLPARQEVLSPKDKLNEYIITGLRTMWGINRYKVKEMMPPAEYKRFQKDLEKYLDNHWIEETASCCRLTDEGKFMSDTVMRDLLWTE